MVAHEKNSSTDKQGNEKDPIHTVESHNHAPITANSFAVWSFIAPFLSVVNCNIYVELSTCPDFLPLIDETNTRKSHSHQ